MIFTLYLAQGSEFAFVLLGFGATSGVLGTDVAQMLVASVALSMALTPLIMIFEEKVLRPRFGTKEVSEREPDHMDEEAPVILVGVGRFGNFVARLLRYQKVDVTVIDNDSEHIEFLRRLGIKAYYGDANRHDLLEAAGADKAKLIICTLDEEEKVEHMIKTVRKHFPHLKIMARALSRKHEYELIEEEVDFAIHQNAGSAIQLGEAALVKLGYRAHYASRAAKAFAKHDREATREMAEMHRDESAYISRVRQSLSELEERFEADTDRKQVGVTASWDPAQLRKDTKDLDYSDIVGGGEGD